MTSAYVGLGTNLGEREHNLDRALGELGRIPGISLNAVSPRYETEPQGYADQPWFLNQVARLVCKPEVTPEGLLGALLGIESDMGRVRVAPEASEQGAEQRFGPRIVDLDLLLFGDIVMESPRLTLPHPRMRDRAFVLVPLADIAPDLVFPDGDPLTRALARIRFQVVDRRIRQ